MGPRLHHSPALQLDFWQVAQPPGVPVFFARKWEWEQSYLHRAVRFHQENRYKTLGPVLAFTVTYQCIQNVLSRASWFKDKFVSLPRFCRSENFIVRFNLMREALLILTKEMNASGKKNLCRLSGLERVHFWDSDSRVSFFPLLCSVYVQHGDHLRSVLGFQLDHAISGRHRRTPAVHVCKRFVLQVSSMIFFSFNPNTFSTFQARRKCSTRIRQIGGAWLT